MAAAVAVLEVEFLTAAWKQEALALQAWVLTPDLALAMRPGIRQAA